MFSPCLRPTYFALLFALAPVIGSAKVPSTPAAVLPAEQRIVRIVCRANPDQSYAVFLPSHYAPGARWPVLFCFDPRARGDMPVGLFAAAAEKHGFIVAGSYNSRNGPVADNDVAIAAMLRDVSERWSLDPARVYAAGFSGGARVATRVGLSGLAKGVIACGGGFLDSQLTPELLAFDFYGYAGTDDFNRGEMLRIEDDLQGGFAAHRLTIFPAEHNWLPKSLTEGALGWLDAQSRHVSIRDRYRKFIGNTLLTRWQAAAQLPPSDSYLEYAALASEGRPWIDRREARRQKRRLADAPEVRRDGPMSEQLLATMGDDWFRRAGDVADPSVRATLEVWRQQAAEKGSPRAWLARCALAGACLRSCERAAVTLAEQGPGDAAFHWAGLAAELAPDEPVPAYNLACVAALAGQPAEALAALRQAVRNGFVDAGAAAQDPAFASLSTKPEFRALLADMGR